MAKQIMQFRYYSEGDRRNQPDKLTMARLVKGSVFANYLPITQLGIQTLPGTKVYLNNSSTPILIGSTGIYELDLEGVSEITDIRIDRDSMNTINRTDNAYLLVDVISDV